MSYLARLKREKPEKALLRVLTKPTEVPCVSSVSDPSRRVQEKTLPAIFEYQLSDRPGCWLVMISRSGTGLEAARQRLTGQFGADRVIEVRERAL